MKLRKLILFILSICTPSFAWAQGGLTRMNNGINLQTGPSYAIACADALKLVQLSNGSAQTPTIPSAATCGIGLVFQVQNVGAGLQTLTPTTSTISYVNGTSYTSAASTLPIATGQEADIYNNGTNYVAILIGIGGTPSLGAATATSLLASGNVDGTAPITITTGTTANLGTTFKSGYTLNQEGTAGTAVTYTLPAIVVGMQYCVANSIVSGTGAANTGVLTVYPQSGNYVIYKGVRNTVGGGGTHGIASGGAAADAACFVAIDSNDWTVYAQSGNWTEN